MQYWATAIIFFICACGAVFYTALRRKAVRPLAIVLLTILALNILVLSSCAGQTATPSSAASEMSTESAAATDAPPPPSIPETDTATDTPPSSSVPETEPTIAPPAEPSTEELAVMFVDPYIDEAIARIDADRRQYSGVTFSYEPKLLYDGLSREEKTMYDEMLENTRHLNPFSYTAAEQGYDVMNMAMSVQIALTTDHPDIDTYFVLYEVVEGNKNTALEALYFMPWDPEQQPADLELLREELLRFDSVCNRIVERMPEEYSTYDKYRYLAAVISLITSYDYEFTWGWQTGTAYGSILGGHSICQGYSRGFLYLCQKADLWCETVEGVVGGNGSHTWNIVKLDSGTYFIDLTWSDELGLPGSPEWDKYFLLTQDELLLDHEITDGKVATGTAID